MAGAFLMDPTYLALSLLFTALGMTLVIYGRKSQRTPHQMAGILLMAFPYFVTNVVAMTSVCLVLAIVPFFLPQTR